MPFRLSTSLDLSPTVAFQPKITEMLVHAMKIRFEHAKPIRVLRTACNHFVLAG